MTDVATPTNTITSEAPEPNRRRRSVGQWFADQDSRELIVWGVLIAITILVRVIGLGEPAVPPRREPGRVLLVPVPQDRRLRVQPAAARPAALLPDRGDVLPVRGHELHRAARAGADGLLDDPDVLGAARPARARRGVLRGAAVRGRPELPVLQPLRPRGHLRRLDHARAADRHLALPRQSAQVPPGADRRSGRALVLHQGDDVHHGLRDGFVLPGRAGDPADPPPGLGSGDARSAGRAGAGASPRSRASSRSSSRPS